MLTSIFQKKKYIILLILPFFLTSCIETAAVSTFSSVYLLKKQSFKKSISDTKIAVDIAGKFKFNKERSKYKNININVDRGRVLLSGYVKKREDLSDAKTIIWDTEGVKEVMSEVAVEKTRRNYLLDTVLATRIKTKLMLDKKVKGLDINVEVYNKNVYLIGHVNSNAEVKHAAKIASKIVGIKKVISYLRVYS